MPPERGERRDSSWRSARRPTVADRERSDEIVTDIALAVTALGAFTGAYGNIMMALLVCQDRKMWTLMPWLYQLQMNSGPGIVFASLLVAAIPTFLVFLCCQNVIMRGIVVPVEK